MVYEAGAENKENDEYYNQFGISYSDNNLINFKVINNKESSAIFSDKIVNKYISVNKDNFINLLKNLEVETKYLENTKNIKNQISAEFIEIDDETKKQKLSEIFLILNNKLVEENFSKQEKQIALIKNDSREVPVTAYTLNISSIEFLDITKEIFTNIKKDKSFLQKFIISSEENKVEEKEESSITNETILNNEITNELVTEETNNMENLTTNEVTNEIELNRQPSNIITIQTFSPVGSNLLTQNIEENVSQNIVENESITSLITEELNKSNIKDIISEEDEEKVTAPIKDKINGIEETKNTMINIALGRKVDASIETIEKTIDFIIDYIKNKMESSNILGEDKELKITVYVSENQTEKINILFSNNATLDIELNSISETEQDIIITFLYEKENIKIFDNLNIQSNQNTISEENVNKIQKNGFKLQIDKQKNNSNTEIKVTYNVIEDEKINQKTLVELTTIGNANSKTFENEFSFGYSNNDGEIKVNIKNKTDFDKLTEIEKLTEENCLFLDNLPEEEKNLILTEVRNKIKEVLENQEKNLDFIDTNTQAPGITQNINKNEIKNLIITEIGKLMGEALARGEIFSIENLKNLQLQDHNMNITIEEGVAKIDIDGLKFSIDANFNLTEIE